MHILRSIAVALVLLTSQTACVVNPPAQSIAYGASAPPGVRVERFSSEDLAAILRDEGYGSVTVQENGNIFFKANGMTCVLYLYDDGDLQLYFGITGVAIGQAAINEWNRTKRLSRAYLDADRDPVLEADLLANAGLSRDMVTAFVAVFAQSVSLFHGYLLEAGEALPANMEDGQAAHSL